MSGQRDLFHELFGGPVACDRRTLWRWLEPHACRLAAAYWWPTLDESDLRSLMRLYATLATEAPHGRGLAGEVRDTCIAIGEEVLNEAIEAMWRQHADTSAALHASATDALRAGADRDGVLSVVLPLARKTVPMPPPWLVQEAIEKAAKEYRFETGFWRKRNGSAA